MDPTLQQQMPGQQAAPGMDPRAMMMLQAIKAGAMGGAHPPPVTGMGTPPQMPMPGPGAPVDPASMAGGLGQSQMAMPQQPGAGLMQQNNPIVNALMSPIPGGGQ